MCWLRCDMVQSASTTPSMPRTMPTDESSKLDSIPRTVHELYARGTPDLPVHEPPIPNLRDTAPLTARVSCLVSMMSAKMVRAFFFPNNTRSAMGLANRADSVVLLCSAFAGVGMCVV